jgi:hypothetical protein
MRNFCRATNRAASAGYAVEGFLCALLKLASLCVCDVLHNVEALGARLGAGVTADARVDLGIKLHHNLLVGLDLIDLISSLISGEEGDRSNVHAFLYLSLASEAGLELILTLNSVNSCTSTAETVAAAATSLEGVACIFHSRHNGKVSGNAVFLTEEIHINHIFHNWFYSFQ